MKNFLLTPVLFILLFSIPGPAFSGERQAWTKSDTALQSTFIVLTLLDWKQTREFASNRHKYPNTYERNPLMGESPSARKVDVVMGASIAAHTAVAFLLPKPYRTVWQGLWIAVEIQCISSNYKAGFSLHF